MMENGLMFDPCEALNREISRKITFFISSFLENIDKHILNSPQKVKSSPSCTLSQIDGNIELYRFAHLKLCHFACKMYSTKLHKSVENCYFAVNPITYSLRNHPS